MKKILILFLFATVLFSCQEEPQPEIIDVEQIRAELDEYVKNRAATRSDNSLYEDIVNFLKEKGFVEVDDPNFPKEQNSSARLNCTTTGALLTLGDGLVGNVEMKLLGKKSIIVKNYYEKTTLNPPSCFAYWGFHSRISEI